MINSTKQRYFFAQTGRVSSGGSENLAKGELMLADAHKANADGLLPLSLTGLRKDVKRLKFLVGEDKSNRDIRSYVHGSAETFPFALNQIKAIRKTMPKTLKQTNDAYIIGWNGRSTTADRANSLSFRPNDEPFRIAISFKKGGSIFKGTANEMEFVDFSYPFDATILNSCSGTEDLCYTLPCGTITKDIVERLKETMISGGKKFKDFFKVSAILSCASTTASTVYTFYTLKVCDAGTQQALADVKSQYPNVIVVRTGREGSKSVYTMMKTGSAPAQYTQNGIEIMPTCSTCPGSWTGVGGYVYSVTTQVKSVGGDTIDEIIEGEVNTATVSLLGIENGTNTNVYTVLNPTFIGTDVILGVLPEGSTVTYLGEQDKVCSKTTTTNTSWVSGDTCNVGVDLYRITLPDTECGTSRLSELQVAYAGYSITEVSLSSSNCQRTYEMSVPTEMLCTECEVAIANAVANSVAPTRYMDRNWVLTTPATEVDEQAGCYCGIKIEGRYFELNAYDSKRYGIPYIEDTPEFYVSAGFKDSVSMFNAEKGFEATVHVEKVSNRKKRDMLAGELIPKWRHAQMYSHGKTVGNDATYDDLSGMSFPIDNLSSQVVQYSIDVVHDREQQGFQSSSGVTHTFNFFVDYASDLAFNEVNQLFSDISASADIPMEIK
jgi:hypothetical protein